MSSDFTGRAAVVTGAGAGIGRAIAEELAARGTAVVVSDIDAGAAGEVAEAITRGGDRAVAMRVDANDAEDNLALVETCVREFGRLDFGVNNAGLGAPPTLLHEIDEKTFDRAMGVTVRGTFLGMRAQVERLIAQLDEDADSAPGAIVNISSIAALQASRLLSPYIAAKHAVLGLTRTAALDYAERGIRINTVAPGPIRTAAFESLPEERIHEEEGKVPLQRLGEPEDIARAVCWLLSDEASFVTGTVLPVDGGSVLL